MQTDVVIAGGGLAGIVAALELLEQDQQVILVDRSTPDRFGGLARCSFGGLFYVDSPLQRKRGIKDSEPLALEDWLSYAEFGEADHWPRQWAEAYVSRCTAEVYEWLKPKGVRYIPFIQWVERGYHRHGNRVPRFHMVWGTGEALVDTLVKALNQHPRRGQLKRLFQHEVTDLLMREGQVAGVKGVHTQTGAAFEVEAGATILASGGITGDLSVLRQHWYGPWGSPPAYFLTGSHRVADGRVHQIARRHGAQLTHLDKQWHYAAGVHHPEAEHPGHGLSLVPPKSALWVNAQGARIGPEPMMTGFDTRLLVEQVLQQPGQYSWQVMNRKIALKELFVSGSKFNDANRNQSVLGFGKTLLLGNHALLDTLIRHGRDVVVADTLEELVSKMRVLSGTREMELETLRASLETYDAAVRRGPGQHDDPQLKLLEQVRQYRGDRMRSCNFQPILDPKAGPLIAIREFVLARKSLGGMQTDLACRVLDGGGQPLPGLYAVGEAAGFGGGGIHGLRALEGTFLGNCIFNGRVAARAVAGRPLLG
ncbi:MAG: FAD-binding dehydrogenase [Bacteroidetes bacterium]|nr:MAG: FAD-binding dehydrogenase [Bacteroidota bacterium]